MMPFGRQTSGLPDLADCMGTEDRRSSPRSGSGRSGRLRSGSGRQRKGLYQRGEARDKLIDGAASANSVFESQVL